MCTGTPASRSSEAGVPSDRRSSTADRPSSGLRGTGLCEDPHMAAEPDAATKATSPAVDPELPLGESRWPPALALLAFMAINIALRVWLPNDSPVRVAWLVPAIEGVLLAILLLGPATVPEGRRWVRRVAVTFVVILVLAALWATVLLIYDLIRGEGVTETPSELLASGGVVWLGNNLSFALLYWLMDGGGPLARSRRPPRAFDFAFTQQIDRSSPPGGGRSSWTTSTSASRTRRPSARPTSCRSRSARSTRWSSRRRWHSRSSA